MQAEVRTEVSWSALQQFVEQRQGSWPLLAYLDGVLELRHPSADGQQRRKYISAIVEAALDQRGGTYDGCRSWLSSSASDCAAIEPDECYVLDEPTKPVPDLVLHVESAFLRIDPLEVYRRLRVSEVWLWIDKRLVAHVLTSRGFEQRGRSEWLPGFDFDLVPEMLNLPALSEVHRQARARFVEKGT